MNTPILETKRLILRKFTENDLSALFAIYSDKEVNTFLPWFPLKSIEEARKFFEENYITIYTQSCGYGYAICLKDDNIPIGYVNISNDDSHDLGYGLLKKFWHKKIVSEAVFAVIEQAKRDQVLYLTATHDINNVRSGNVMKAVGMCYQYSYKELWMPRNIPVIFRMYQINLDGNKERVYKKYWDKYPEHFIENL